MQIKVAERISRTWGNGDRIISFYWEIISSKIRFLNGRVFIINHHFMLDGMSAFKK